MENIRTIDNNIIPQEIAEKIVDNILLRRDHFKVMSSKYLNFKAKMKSFEAHSKSLV